MCRTKKLTIILCCLLFFATAAAAKIVRLDYIGENPLRNGKPAKDTIPYIDILDKLDWDVTVLHSDGKALQYVTSKPDTLEINDAVSVSLTSSFIVSTQLLNQVYVLHYFGLGGSILVKLNGAVIAATGSFAKDKTDKASRIKQDDFSDILFGDTMQRMEVTYIPQYNKKHLKLQLAIDQLNRVKELREDKIQSLSESYALGFYYLAFAILFIILFIFLRVRTENLYFSLFCFCASMAFLWHSFKIDFFDNAPVFLTILSLEFLSIFFAKVLKNKEKSKIPVIIIFFISLICAHPAISNYTVSFFGQQSPLLLMAIISILMSFAIISTLYFLIQGIGQKRWEAKAVVIICAIAFALSIIVPAVVISFVNSSQSKDFLTDISSNIGLCIYPLSAAIVLGRRNGMNQKQLFNQVKSIEKLSAENLEKEKEKQLLLESQNTELERKVKERTAEVQRQKELVEIKNKAITDNINYAQRIQSAILPDIKLIYKALEQSFILFLPKDVVSGDFYAFAEKNGRVLIIAGDCTGHGVSGAFMSMIGSSLLNQIINEKSIVEPAQILNQLNSSVIETFRQGENESNDGMDVSICSFDLNSNELEYAGANRPLWLLRNNELQTFRPDKFPIGGLQMAKDRSFTNYTIQLQKEDTIYIFTDGYADQFGGGEGKKMMTARFKEMLLAIQNKNMKEQEIYLKEYFETWKGISEQVDDVLVIGVRV